MHDIHTMLRRLRRPALLIRAARHGLDGFDRSRHLPRLLKCEKTPRPADALMQLMSREAAMNAARRDHAAEYTHAGHVDLLIAIMCEARMLQETARPRVVAQE